MNKKAFTMIELTLVIVVLAIVSVVGVQVIRFTYEQRVRTQILNDLEVQSQMAIDYISKNTKNAIRNSIRVKKDYTSNCKNSTDCKFVYNISNDFSSTHKVLEWANIDVDTKRAGWWDGINRTKCVIAQTLRADTTGVSKDFSTATGGTPTPEPKCFDGSDSGQFLCFAFRHDVRTCNEYMLQKDRAYNRGIYFLGDNITNSNAFIENDLLNLEVQGDQTTSKISFDTKVKNFTITNAYVLVDRINGVKLENNELKFYTLTWDKDIWSGTGKKSISVTNKYTLVKNVKSFNIQSLGDSIAFTLCLESNKEVSTSLFGTSKTKISVCKSGVML